MIAPSIQLYSQHIQDWALIELSQESFTISATSPTKCRGNIVNISWKGPLGMCELPAQWFSKIPSASLQPLRFHQRQQQFIFNIPPSADLARDSTPLAPLLPATTLPPSLCPSGVPPIFATYKISWLLDFFVHTLALRLFWTRPWAFGAVECPLVLEIDVLVTACCGLPQGSPVLPILFLLYTEPIYRLGNPQGRFGYADDADILSVGDTVEETSTMASRSIEDRRTAPEVRHGDVGKHPEAALRWLGVWLDSRLSFRIHVEKWAAKAKAVAYHLRGLTNTIHGPLPSAVRSAFKACVEPVLLHGSEAWYPGKTRPRWTQPMKDLQCNQHLLQRMSKAMNQAMRAILPVRKTTPTAILRRESGIPPIDQLLEIRRLRFSARLKSLDESHPLASRTHPPRQHTYHDLIKRRYQTQTENVFRTRRRRADELLAPCPQPKLVQRCFQQEEMVPLQTASKEKTTGAFL
ncbi:reverse transcriptase [Fusarium mundagurra]|uniref:Reverse transcriptase n=1 Tax=Fusarium mundagurra TaxID=1567541 RepID=A0A8H5Z6C9_9HYPO|nr:reverse transcriptase [Fusarium mundagurra]